MIAHLHNINQILDKAQEARAVTKHLKTLIKLLVLIMEKLSLGLSYQQ